MSDDKTELVKALRSQALRISGAPDAYDALLEFIGDARLVLLGESTHGTHEFYSERAKITQRLIREKGFSAVAVEADWPHAFRVNRYVRGAPGDADAIHSLGGFQHFPSWLWRNTDVLNFIDWLHVHNGSCPNAEAQTGFYGIDLYSLNSSIEAVLRYLDKVDPDAAKRARYRYGCFEHFGEDSQAYGYAAGFGLSASCEEEAVNELVELRHQAARYVSEAGPAHDEFFYAEQNARLITNAERYYRTLFQSRIASWNVRDQHMAETLIALLEHLSQRQGHPSKMVVWAHNSHIGDARATEMGDLGELNVGQLMREHYGDDVVLIGFSTNSGTVTAASEWGGEVSRKRVRAALPDSYEALLHETGVTNFLLILHGNKVLAGLHEPRLARAIGVIYLPHTERVSHYFSVRLADQFDALLHFDETRAIEPLERTATWERGEVPETFPFSV